MNKTELFRKYLLIQKENLLKAIEKEKDARDNAPSAMESHSDTRRTQADNFIAALNDQLSELTKYENQINSIDLKYVEAKINSENKKFLIVPKGLGGIEISDIRLLSNDAPLGLLLIDKKPGEKFEFGGKEVEILEAE